LKTEADTWGQISAVAKAGVAVAASQTNASIAMGTNNFFILCLSCFF
jgi:hypothetical protein